MIHLTGDENLLLDQVRLAVEALLNAKNNECLPLVKKWVVKALLCRCDDAYRKQIRYRLSIPDSHVPEGVESKRVTEVKQLLRNPISITIKITCGDYEESTEVSV